MNHLDFYSSISKMELGGAYLFYGSEGLLMDRTSDRILKTYVNPMSEELNSFSMNGNSATTENIINAVETVPFMSDYKLIVVNEVGEFLSNVELSDKFYNFLDAIDSSAILLFIDNSGAIKKNTKFYKYFKKHNRDIEFAKLNNADFNKFVNGEFKLHKKSIRPSELSVFANNTGYFSRNREVNLYQVLNEIKKISSLTAGDVITQADIDKLMVQSADVNVFDFLDSLVNRRVSDSLKNFYSLYQLNEPAQRLLFMIVRQYRLLLGYKTYIVKGYSEVEVMKKLGIKSFEFSKLSRSQRMYTECDIIDIMEYINDAERKMKSTSIDERLIIEELIVKICA